MRQTAGWMAATTAATPAIGAAKKLRAAATRSVGRTGLSCSLLGVGTGTNGWNGSSNQTRKGRQHFVSLLEHAYDSGLTCFDLADMYGSHSHMKDALREGIPREKVMLVTKTVSRDPAVVRADIERYRKELDTDYLDIVLFHCVTDEYWPEKMKPCMDVLEEAKHKGLVRAHGLSCHTLGALRRTPEIPWVDVVLARINPYGAHTDGPVKQVVPVLQQLHDAGKGVLGMKIVGNGDLKDRIRPSLEFVTGLGCVDAFVIGFESTNEVATAMAHLETLSGA